MPSASRIPTKYSRSERARRRAEMARLVADGHRPAEVAAAHEVSVNRVLVACSEHGVRVPRQPQSSKKEAILVALRAGDESPVDIALRLGVTRQRVYEVRDEAVAAGVPLPDHVAATARPRHGP